VTLTVSIITLNEAKKLEKREAQKTADKKNKQRHQDRKNIGKRRKPSASTTETAQ